MVKDKKYNNQGMVDFAKAWGSVCSSRNCEECSVDIIKGADISCPEFARQFPKKFVSLILDEYEGGITYANEYALRFPNCKMTAEDFVALGMCRRAVFESYLDCEYLGTGNEERCIECWKERYIADSEDDIVPDEESESGESFNDEDF